MTRFNVTQYALASEAGQIITFYWVPKRHHRERLDNNIGTHVHKDKLRTWNSASSAARTLSDTKPNLNKPRIILKLKKENY